MTHTRRLPVFRVYAWSASIPRRRHQKGREEMISRKRSLPLLILVTLTTAYAQDVRTGEDVLRVMHDRYAKSWYKTLIFTQKSTTYNADGTTKVDTWHEALSLPAKLRIDIGPPNEKNGYLMVDGTLTIF